MATHASRFASGGSRRVLLLVTLAAAVAVAAIVGGTLLQSRGETTTLKGSVTKPRHGYPRLELSFGVRDDAEAQALARAQTAYDAGRIAAAAVIFARYGSLEARIGAAFADWKSGGFATMKQLGAAYPSSPLVQLHLGIADFWAGRNADALTAWERTARIGADTPYGVSAEDFLHPKYRIPGLPVIVTGLEFPRGLRHVPVAQQVVGLRRAAARPDADAKLLYGYVLWRLEMPISAERQFAAAAALAPHDALARTLAAVGRFSKASPVRAFAKLGPLTAVFPKSAAVQFHLAVLLLYIGENGKAAQHFRLAIADGPHSPYAEPARTLLAPLARTRSK